MTLKELQARSLALAREKGWWDGTRDVDEVYACFHAEVSEAWEEYRSGRPILDICIDHEEVQGPFIDADEKCSECWEMTMNEAEKGGKPTGFFVELADLCIRIADATEVWKMRLKLEDEFLSNQPETVPALMRLLHTYISDAWNMHDDRDEAETNLGLVVDHCFAFAKRHKVDLFAVVDLKHEYNKTRARKHGKIA